MNTKALLEKLKETAPEKAAPNLGPLHQAWGQLLTRNLEPHHRRGTERLVCVRPQTEGLDLLP